MLGKPEYDWETRGFPVNDGPSVVRRNGRIWLSYSASATEENHAMGLLRADEDTNLLDPAAWTKSREPVCSTCYDHGIYGPGHNSSTHAGDSDAGMLAYHARAYTRSSAIRSGIRTASPS